MHLAITERLKRFIWDPVRGKSTGQAGTFPPTTPQVLYSAYISEFTQLYIVDSPKKVTDTMRYQILIK